MDYEERVRILQSLGPGSEVKHGDFAATKISHGSDGLLIKYHSDVERKFGGHLITGPFTAAYTDVTCDGIEVMEKLHPQEISNFSNPNLRVEQYQNA